MLIIVIPEDLSPTSRAQVWDPPARMSTAAPKRATGRALKRRLRPPKPSWPSWKEKVRDGVTKLQGFWCLIVVFHIFTDPLIGYHRDLSYLWWWNTNHNETGKLYQLIQVSIQLWVYHTSGYSESANFWILLEKVIIEAPRPQSSPLPQHLAWPPISMPQECKPPAVTATAGPRPDGSGPSHH